MLGQVFWLPDRTPVGPSHSPEAAVVPPTFVPGHSGGSATDSHRLPSPVSHGHSQRDRVYPRRRFLVELGRTAASSFPGEVYLLGLRQNEDFRCNMGFAEFEGSDAEVTVVLFNINAATLRYLASKTYAVPAFGQFQVNRIFSDIETGRRVSECSRLYLGRKRHGRPLPLCLGCGQRRKNNTASLINLPFATALLERRWGGESHTRRPGLNSAARTAAATISNGDGWCLQPPPE